MALLDTSIEQITVFGGSEGEGAVKPPVIRNAAAGNTTFDVTKKRAAAGSRLKYPYKRVTSSSVKKMIRVVNAGR